MAGWGHCGLESTKDMEVQRERSEAISQRASQPQPLTPTNCVYCVANWDPHLCHWKRFNFFGLFGLSLWKTSAAQATQQRTPSRSRSRSPSNEARDAINAILNAVVVAPAPAHRHRRRRRWRRRRRRRWHRSRSEASSSS